MALDLLRDCTFFGPALPEPFVKFELEKHLRERQLLPRADGAEGRALQERWEVYRRKLRALGEHGGDLRVASHVLAPLTERLGYASFERQNEVGTREGLEDGGWLMSGEDSSLRCWSVELGTDLDAPNLRGRAYRFSPARVAQRVLLAQSERVGLLTDGEELRILICDPARPDSHIAIRLDQSNGWRASSEAPDSYRLLLALASPSGTKAIPDLTEAARLAQATVTRKLRVQARRAIEDFIQSVLDQPVNAPVRATNDADELAKTLWREGLVLVYRLLFIFKLESSADPARAFSFAATSLWRNTYSPNVALASLVRKVLDDGAETGGLLEEGLRGLWRMFAHGLSSRELQVSALGGMLFGEGATPLLDRLHWGETAVAKLLDALLWTPSEGRAERERVHYGALDVEDLGRVYEALLELEPGFAIEPMCRLRRAKLEVVVPAAQGEAYRSNTTLDVTPEDDESDSDAEEEEAENAETPKESSKSAGKTRILFVESIPLGRFFLRVGLGRKSSGSYYTPHPFVRFLVQETIGPQIAERSPQDDPQPDRILALKVLDPAMGSGHFLVEACRFLGESLYEACRLCDELALQAEAHAGRVSDPKEKEHLLRRCCDLRKRVEDLPDPDNELISYLPSRVLEGQESGVSQRKAEALCRRLVAVHSIYGVDKNPLAVELAKLSLWLESYAEGLPLTFLDHRLIAGDSLIGPFGEHLLTYPRTGDEVRGLFVNDLAASLTEALKSSLAHVRDLEASVGKDLADLQRKQAAKEKLDRSLNPFRLLADAWSRGVMLGEHADDEEYLEVIRKAVGAADGGQPNHERLDCTPRAKSSVLAYDLVFPEVFYPGGAPERAGGFDAVLGNPPWDSIQFKSNEFFASFDLGILEVGTKRERAERQARLLSDSTVNRFYEEHKEDFERQKRNHDRLYRYQKIVIDGDLCGRQLDLFRIFMERNAQLVAPRGITGVLVPSAFHANEGATGIRRLYIEELALKYCFSFENRRKYFDIDSRFKFAAVVARRERKALEKIDCAFYLNDAEWLFNNRRRALSYTRSFLKMTGGEYLAFPEPRTHQHLAIIQQLFDTSRPMAEWLSRHGLAPNTSELPMLGKEIFLRAPKGDARLPRIASHLVAEGLLPLHEGKTFHQYSDLWGSPPRYVVRLSGLISRVRWYTLAQNYRFGYRAISASTNERTGIACIMPPPTVSTRKVASDVAAGLHPNWPSLGLVAIFNSFTFDFLLRSMVQTDVSLFIVKRVPVPTLTQIENTFISHASLRLTCNHEGFRKLWIDQLGDRWREPAPKYSWPVLSTLDEHWQVRAAIDALIARAYGLSRDQYAYVLGSFSHKSYPKAPTLCLTAFDEHQELSLVEFAKVHDAYWDVPLNDSLPNPAIDLPELNKKGLGIEESGQLVLGLVSSAPPTGKARLSTAHPHRQRRGHSDENNERYEWVVSFLKEHQEITSRDAQDLTGLDANAVRPYLERLVEEGLAIKEGQRRGTKYRKAGADA